MSDTSETTKSENHKLKKALADLIPWAGILPEGPDWATPEAKAKNRQAFESALEAACACFPEDYNSIQEIADSN